ncbi:IclR family transcriptional regulator [Micromonospora echinofusca]|uniref:Helix-turn-helix domain-containing protein n=1 Tax=Micromonospora echinofusca TaxID=47858 RepID=A0ABS3VYK8_MICEH|nr:IclR family transcriptional regulator [Micromonospora echinofusca]MBO4209630.1 helix-turn-helix domain-containing protein [Micromonospora echinofusca]
MGEHDTAVQPEVAHDGAESAIPVTGVEVEPVPAPVSRATTRSAKTSENGNGDAAAPAIQTVQRAAMILNAFTVSRPRLTLNELTASLGTSKATAHRYTKALRESNLLRYDEREAVYSLGPQILTLSAAARAGMPVIAVAGPHMQRLVREIDETVVLSVWDGDTAVVVRVDDNTDRVIRVSVRTGSRLSRTESAQGRVFCAFLPEGDVPGLPSATAASAELREEIEKIRRDGISANTPSVNGVRSISAPIFRGTSLIAALAIVGTTTSVPEGTHSPLAAALKRTAAEITAELGRDRAVTNGTAQHSSLSPSETTSLLTRPGHLV